MLPNGPEKRNDKADNSKPHSAIMQPQSSTRATKSTVQERLVSEAQVEEEAARSCHFCRAQSGARTQMSKLLMCASALLLVVLALSVPVAESVDCFKCSSRNGSNPACEDPFHNLNTTRVNQPLLPEPQPNVIYHTPCYAGRKGREGLFPASTCIKLTGTFARMSHCGKFQFEGDLLKGCVLACPEDACNSAPSARRLLATKSTLIAQVLLSSMIAMFLSRHAQDTRSWSRVC